MSLLGFLKGTKNVVSGSFTTAWSGLSAIPSVVAKIATGTLHLGGLALTVSREVKQVAKDLSSIRDKSNGVANIPGIDPQTAQRYAHVDPKLVGAARQELGDETLNQIDDLTLAIEDKFATTTRAVKVAGAIATYLPYSDSVQVAVKTGVLGTATWLTDRLRTVLPDGDIQARRNFADAIAQDADYALSQVQSAVKEARQKSSESWGGLTFEKRVDDALKTSEMGKAQGEISKFYDKLADRILKELDTSLLANKGNPLADLLNNLFGKFDAYAPQKRKEAIKDLLEILHKEITNPEFIKQRVTELLDETAESLEKVYTTYKQHLFNPSLGTSAATGAPTAQAQNIDPAYGHSLMNLLQILQPKVFHANIMAGYSHFHAEDIAKGKDWLSIMLGDATATSIYPMMSSNTNKWLSEAIKLAHLKLLDSKGQLLQCPSYIPQKTWDRLSPDERKDAITEGSATNKEYKKMHERNVHLIFAGSTMRLSKAVFRAAYIAEQFFKTSAQKAQSATSRPAKIFWTVMAKIVSLPLLGRLIEAFRRFFIWIRETLADATSTLPGKSIARRMDAFLKTQAFERVWMHMLEKGLEHMHIIPPSNTSTAWPAGALPGQYPATVAPLQATASATASAGQASHVAQLHFSPIPAPSMTAALTGTIPDPTIILRNLDLSVPPPPTDEELAAVRNQEKLEKARLNDPGDEFVLNMDSIIATNNSTTHDKSTTYDNGAGVGSDHNDDNSSTEQASQSVSDSASEFDYYSDTSATGSVDDLNRLEDTSLAEERVKETFISKIEDVELISGEGAKDIILNKLASHSSRSEAKAAIEKLLGSGNLKSATIGKDGTFTLMYDKEKSSKIQRTQKGLYSVSNYTVTRNQQVEGKISNDSITFKEDAFKFTYFLTSALKEIKFNKEGMQLNFNSYNQKTLSCNEESFNATFEGWAAT